MREGDRRTRMGEKQASRRRVVLVGVFSMKIRHGDVEIARKKQNCKAGRLKN